MKQILIILTIVMLFACQQTVISKTDQIKLNSLGYLPDAPKVATINGEAATFKLIDSVTGKTVLKGKTSAPIHQADVDQTVVLADFSEMRKEGTYCVVVDGLGKSADFAIAADAYNSALKTAMRGFYLWRCGTAVEGDFNGDHFSHAACHLDDGYTDYIGKKGEKRDGTGGWHDAGDHGKYTVNAGVTMALLFHAWNQFSDKLKDIDLDIPETTPGMSDYLQELKWETDFLLKMQYPDGTGRVSHKLTRKTFSGFIMPEDDHDPRYFTEWSSAATADFVAMMAMAYNAFRVYDKEYAQKCLDAAKVSYDYLAKHPGDVQFVQGDFHTGGYPTTDPDDRLWAASEMWEATGDAQYLTDLENRITEADAKVESNWDWDAVINLGMFTYALSEREGKNSELDAKVKKNILLVADTLVENAKTDIYGRTLGDRYYWGCNGTVARQALNLQVANQLSPDSKYIHAVEDIVAHLFGRNYYGRSYVTGLGINPPMFPHDRRSGADSIVAPWPGYLVGGGHAATDWVDEQSSYQRNEIAINWQAGLVYALAGLAY